MKKSLTVLSVFCLIIMISCDKDKDVEQKACWQLIDHVGNDVDVVCDKTESELIECVRNGSCSVYSGVSVADFDNCDYYKPGGAISCWQINNAFVGNITENKAQLFARCRYGGNVSPATGCNPCQAWYTREKRTYKPANTITYTPTIGKPFCGDTLAVLYPGKQIIRKDDADSLVIIQFSDDAVNW